MNRKIFGISLWASLIYSSMAFGVTAPNNVQGPSAAQVEDDGGFDEPYFVEDTRSNPEHPTSLALGLKERTDQVESAINGSADFQDYVQFLTNSGKQTRCNVSTLPCEAHRWGRMEEVHVIISKFHGKVNDFGKTVKVPETLRFVANLEGFGWMELFNHAVSTGIKNCDGKDCTTPSGDFPLAQKNMGRIYSTRNHCSGVADYGQDQGQFVELAPMPYSVHFNGGIAMHTGYTTGTPRSHGCVRQGNDGARMTYCALLEEDNWKRATVHVVDDPVFDGVDYVQRLKSQSQNKNWHNDTQSFIQKLSY